VTDSNIEPFQFFFFSWINSTTRHYGINETDQKLQEQCQLWTRWRRCSHLWCLRWPMSAVTRSRNDRHLNSVTTSAVTQFLSIQWPKTKSLGDNDGTIWTMLDLACLGSIPKYLCVSICFEVKFLDMQEGLYYMWHLKNSGTQMSSRLGTKSRTV